METDGSLLSALEPVTCSIPQPEESSA